MNLNPFYSPLMVFTFFIMALGGCLDAASLDDEGSTTVETEKTLPTEPAPKAKATKESGSLEGQVADDEFRPIHGALVSLVNQTGPVLEALTDRDGKYTINDVPPGEYGVLFTADCCEDHLDRVRIETDTISRISATLRNWIEFKEPYIKEDQWSGFISCAGRIAEGTLYALDDYCRYDQNHDSVRHFDIQSGIDTLLVAMEWSDGINLEDCLRLQVIVRGLADQYRYGTIHDTGCHSAPIEFRMDSGNYYGRESSFDHTDYEFSNITESMPLEYRVDLPPIFWGGDVTPNLVFQQSFTVYWQEWYWKAAPPDATALPDT